MTHLVIMLAGEARSGKDTATDILVAELEERGYHVTRTYFAKALKESLKNIFGLTDEHVFGKLKETPFDFTINPEELIQRTIAELHHGSLMSIDVNMHKAGFKTPVTAARIVCAMIDAICKGGTEVAENVFTVSPRQLMQWWGTEAVREGAYQDAWIDCVKYDIGMENSPNQIALISDARFDNEVKAMQAAYPYCWEELDGGVLVLRTHRGDKVKVNAHVSEAGISNELVDFEIDNNDTLTALSHKLMSILDQNLDQ